jgi:hypothetical protein
LRVWTKVGISHKDKSGNDDEEIVRETEAQIINLLTKDINVFIDGSWAFPYLIVVPVNLVVSGFILYQMYGLLMLICFVAMGALLLL